MRRSRYFKFSTVLSDWVIIPFPEPKGSLKSRCAYATLSMMTSCCNMNHRRLKAKTANPRAICRRILYCVKENLCGVLVRQSIWLYLSYFLRLSTIHTISELSTFKRSRVSRLLLHDSDSIYLLLQRKYTPKLCKTEDWHYSFVIY